MRKARAPIYPLQERWRHIHLTTKHRRLQFQCECVGGCVCLKFQQVSLELKTKRYILTVQRCIIRVSSAVQRWATGWMIGGSSPGRGWEFFSSPPRPDRSGGPPRLLSNGYRGFFPWGGGGSKTATHHQVPRSRMRGAIPPLPNTPSWRDA
jgi:hypothetical protein